MAEQQGGFPQDKSRKDDAYSTTGDGHPPRTGDKGQGGTIGQGQDQSFDDVQDAADAGRGQGGGKGMDKSGTRDGGTKS